MMFLPLLLIGGTLAGVAVVALSNSTAPGLGAFDTMPPNFSGPPVGAPIPVKAKSGRVFNVSGWRPVNGETYQVAVLDKTPGTWIAYFSNKETGRRRLFRTAASSTAERDSLMSDFGVTA
jgi:hypothetical protein